MRPSASSRATWSLLTRLQAEPGLRGLNQSIERVASLARVSESTQPQARPSCTIAS